MTMKKIIQQELGSELEKIGFTYVSGERLFWPYVRMKNGIKQEIIVARDRYEKRYIKVIFATNAYGQRPQEFQDFVPEEGAEKWEFWGYETEEELRKILQEFKRLIFSYGLDFLEKISEPATDAIPTAESNRYLYLHHRELYEEYQAKLNTEGKKAEDVISTIYQKMEEISDEPFERAEEILIPASNEPSGCTSIHLANATRVNNLASLLRGC